MCEDYGFILKVDLEYPKDPHDKHAGYLLAPEEMKVKEKCFSGKQTEFLEDKKYTTTEKLIPNLFDKENYVVYCDNVTFYACVNGLKR